LIKNVPHKESLIYFFNKYHIFEPRVLYSLIEEFNSSTFKKKSLESNLEDFLYQKFLDLYIEFTKSNYSIVGNKYPLKDEFFQIVYSYGISLEKLMMKNEKDIHLFIKYLIQLRDSRKDNLVEKRKMKSIEISFTPSLEKINKIHLFISIIIWMLIYILIFYFKFL